MSSRLYRTASVTFFACLFLTCRIAAAAFSVDLVWDPSPSDPTGLVYTAYYGTQSGKYDFSSARVSTTNLSIENLSRGTWFFVVKARYGDGPESEPSNEASITLSNHTSRHVTLDIDGDGRSDSIALRRPLKGSKQEYRILLSSKAYARARAKRTSSSVMYNAYPGGGLMFTLNATRGYLKWRATTGKPRLRAALPGRFSFALSGCDFDGDGTGDFAGFRNKGARLHYLSSKAGAIVASALALPSDSAVIDFYCADVQGADNVHELLALLTDARGAQRVAVFSAAGAILKELPLSEKRAVSLFTLPAINDALFLATLRRDASSGLITDFFFRNLDEAAPAARRWHLKGGADDVSPGIFTVKNSQETYSGLELLVGDTLTRFDATPLGERALPKLLSTRKLGIEVLQNSIGNLLRPVSVVRTKNQ